MYVKNNQMFQSMIRAMMNLAFRRPLMVNNPDACLGL